MASILDNILLGQQNPGLFGGQRNYLSEYGETPVMASAPVSSPVSVEQPQANPMLQAFEMFKTIKDNPEYASIFGRNNEQQINEALAERDKIGKFNMKNWLTATLPSLGILALGSLMTRGRGGDPGLAMSNIQQGYQKGVENRAAIDLDTWTKKWQTLQENAKSGDAFKKLIAGNIMSEVMKEELIKNKPFERDTTKELWKGGKLIAPATAKKDISGNVTTGGDGKKYWMYKEGGISPYLADSVPKKFADKWGERLIQNKNGNYEVYAYNKLTNENGVKLRNATEKEIRNAGSENKTTKELLNIQKSIDSLSAKKVALILGRDAASPDPISGDWSVTPNYKDRADAQKIYNDEYARLSKFYGVNIAPNAEIKQDAYQQAINFLNGATSTDDARNRINRLKKESGWTDNQISELKKRLMKK